jgi:hypothetical protein
VVVISVWCFKVYVCFCFSKKNKYTWWIASIRHRKTRHSMLQSFPAYAVYSAIHFQDLACWAPEPVASGQSARQRSGTRAEPGGEEEDYVFV